MKFLIDLNLSPSWIKVLNDSGWSATHWSQIGNLRASDAEIMQWAVVNKYVIFTHDLDFSRLLALTKCKAPSVVQLRTTDVLPNKIGKLVIDALRTWEEQLNMGAIMSIDLQHTRVRLLPFNSP